MDYTEFEALFCRAMQKNGLQPLGAFEIATLHRFSEHLMAVNQVTNLTAIRNLPDVIDKHLIDCLLAAEHLPNGARVLDIGCGAGFPSVPLAITRPDLEIVSLDSTAKKIAFVSESAKMLRLSNLTAISGRAEDAAIRQKLGLFDVVVSRAVANMRVLAELCLPYAQIGGFVLALKGAKGDEELQEARGAIKILGGGDAMLHKKRLILANDEQEQRCLIEIPKHKQTPKGYPRAYAAILKKPL